MDFAQQFAEFLQQAEAKLRAAGGELYTQTAEKIKAKADELRPVLADDVADVEQRAVALLHDLLH